MKITVKFETERCKGCELCVAACPKKLILLNPEDVNIKGYHVAGISDMEQCIGCGSCARMCPDSVISIFKE